MLINISDSNSADLDIFTGDDATTRHRSMSADRVYVDPFGGEYYPLSFTPSVARALAAVLLRAADEAEGVTSREDPRVTVDRLRAFIVDMRDWCSPHGIAADYSDRLMAVLEGK